MTERGYRETLRAEILAKATAILEAEGLEAMQARRVARESGCAVGTLYNVFGDIDGLLIAVNASTLALLGEVVRAEGARVADLPLVERLTALALAYLRFAREHRQRWEAVFKHRLLPGRVVPESYVEDQERLIGVIEAAIEEDVSDAILRARVARTLFGAVHGIVALALDNRLGGTLEAEAEANVTLIVALAARGMTGVVSAPLGG